tara:strand:+ start:239 stop:670 length:432 start_codon:yes stop_codon:yes gene_type:complete
MSCEYLVILNRRTQQIKHVRKENNVDSYGIVFDKYLKTFPQELHELATNLLDMYSTKKYSDRLNLTELLLEIINNQKVFQDFNRNLEILHDYDLKYDFPIRIPKEQLQFFQKYLNNSIYSKSSMNKIIIEQYFKVDNNYPSSS